MRIQIDHLTRTFGNKNAVQDISFEFSTGSIVGFIGPNGAGKTTTIKIMSTLDLPTSGDVTYDGVSVVNDPDQIRRFIGYMPDSLPAFNNIQVWEYLDFYARAFGLKGAQRQKVLADVEEFTSLGGIRDKFLNTLSKGMKQRVSLARALLHNPDVLIMDEPAAGLDPRARLELRSLLQILASQGKAIFLSSHILSELQDICDSAVIIEKGNILSFGTLDHLLENAVGNTAPRQPDSADGAAESAVAAAPSAILQLRLRVLKEPETLRNYLLTLPAFPQVNIINSRDLQCFFKGTEEDIPACIANILAQGFPVTSFVKEEMNLEDVFMKITKGDVQ